jgi:hypothetical protein
MSKETPLFSAELRIEGAKWWANYLARVKDISFAETNKELANAIPNSLAAVVDAQKRKNKVTEEQYNKFIEILAEKINKLKIYNSCNGYSFATLGNASDYDPPQEVQESVKEADIKIPPLLLFPLQTVMKIYDSGQYVVNNKVVNLNPNLINKNSITSTRAIA